MSSKKGELLHKDVSAWVYLMVGVFYFLYAVQQVLMPRDDSMFAIVSTLAGANLLLIALAYFAPHQKLNQFAFLMTFISFLSGCFFILYLASSSLSIDSIHPSDFGSIIFLFAYFLPLLFLILPVLFLNGFALVRLLRIVQGTK